MSFRARARRFAARLAQCHGRRFTRTARRAARSSPTQGLSTSNQYSHVARFIRRPTSRITTSLCRVERKIPSTATDATQPAGTRCRAAARRRDPRGEGSAASLYSGTLVEPPPPPPSADIILPLLQQQHERSEAGLLGEPSAWSLAAALLVGLLRLPPPSEPQREEAQRVQRDAHVANGRGDYAEARRRFEASYLLCPRPAVLISLSNMLLKEGKLEAAIALYDSLLADSTPTGDSGSGEAVVARRLSWSGGGGASPFSAVWQRRRRRQLHRPHPPQ